MIAVRTNERAAAALGFDVMKAKLFAFALASAIAALGGIVIAFRLSSISYQSFTNFTSITYVAWQSSEGSATCWVVRRWHDGHSRGGPADVDSNWPGVGRWIQLISGIAILLTVLTYKDGVAAEWAKVFKLIKKARKWGRPYTIELADVADPRSATDHHARVPPRTLTLEGLTVRYGVVTAVNDVSYRLDPGTITGLIGPNGAARRR